MFETSLMNQIRERFCHVDTCPYQGPRIFFENAGGALTLKSVVEVNTQLAGIPDNQGRDNPASHELVRIISEARDNMRLFLGVKDGPVFTGESGTELIFRMVRAAALGSPEGGNMIGSTLEHPATVSASKRWAKIAGKKFRAAVHSNDSATITAEDYARIVDSDTRVATIIHTSPVTGMTVDIPAVVKVIRAASPDCIIILDGIQHAAHGGLAIDEYDVDGYAVSAYKVFSRHNYGFAWLSPRLATLPHDHLDGTPDDFWELGTRDTSAFACTTKVIEYFDWLGSHFTDSSDRRIRILAAGEAIGEHEHDLIELMINGNDKQHGLRDMPEVYVIGGHDNPAREGMVSIIVEGKPCAEVVADLNARGIRTHVRKADYFSGNILEPLGRPTCIRVSMCHYNTDQEVLTFLHELETIIATHREPGASAA
ncbi:MAG: aminotransferase class V-fold PLP-dependent enzyme [Gammaproteobacteria bacterium]|nr:aminotransferase class V-fold PLP-dependent enzyme [Gammaproteobacteria bacterium]MDH3858007.1 aminotransferase class V-fold PLP-dependent enzyme [Gammaproteobacteria bacterium]